MASMDVASVLSLSLPRRLETAQVYSRAADLYRVQFDSILPIRALAIAAKAYRSDVLLLSSCVRDCHNEIVRVVLSNRPEGGIGN